MQMIDPIVGPNIRSSDSTDFSEVPFGGWEGFWNAGVSAAENSIGGYIAREVGRGFDAAADRPLTEIEKMTGGRSLWASPVIGDAVSGWLNPKGPMLTADEANQKYSIGDLKFDGPVSEIRASQLNAYARTELRRNQIIQQSQIGAVARFTASLLGGALDPVNWAALPVSEALLIRSGLTGLEALKAGSIGARAVYGGVTGFTSQALLEPGYQFAAAQEGREHGLASALQDLAFGTVLGGGLHAAFGPRAARVNPVSDVIDNASHLEKYQLMRGAVGDVLEDRPVNVAPVVDALTDRIRFRDENIVMPKIDHPMAVVEDHTSLSDQIVAAEKGKVTPSAPRDIVQFIASIGGVKDIGGDLAALDATNKFVPGGGRLVRKNGLTLDDIGEAAHEAGYFGPPKTSERPTERQVLDAIDETLRGNRKFSEADASIVESRRLRDLSRRGEDQLDTISSELRDHIAALADRVGERVTQKQIKKLAEQAVVEGRTAEDVLGDHIERLALQGRILQSRGSLQPAITEVAQSKLQPYQDPVGLQASREAADTVAAAGTAPKARSEDQGIGAATPIVREQDRLTAQTQAVFDEFQKLGGVSAEDAAAIKAAQEAIKEGELLGKARDLAAQCLGEA